MVINSGIERQLQATTIVCQDVQWGFWHKASSWKLQSAQSDSCCIHGTILDGRVSIRGRFDSVGVSLEQDILLTGTLYISGCEGLELRYGIFYHENPGELEFDGTDSAQWSGWNSNAWGYLFLPRSGNQEYPSWRKGGYGSIGVVQNETWTSTFGNASSLGIVPQKPLSATLTDGKYLFAILIKKTQYDRKYIQFYFLKDERIVREQYFFMSESIEDTTTFGQVFNGICFAIIGHRSESATFSVSNLSIIQGNDLQLPSLPQWFTDVSGMYIARWGVVGKYSTGWKFIRESYEGDVSLEGTLPLTDTLVLLGEFSDLPSRELTVGQAYRLEGTIELNGSGFEGNTIKYGIFYTDTLGILQQTPYDSTHWIGCGTRYRGYMVVLPSGTHDLPVWGNTGREGTIGAIVNEECKRTEGFNNYSLSAQRQDPPFAIGTEGCYRFGISIVRWSDYTLRIRGYFIKTDGTYRYIVDTHDRGVQSHTAKYNCFIGVFEPGSCIKKNLFERCFHSDNV